MLKGRFESSPGELANSLEAGVTLDQFLGKAISLLEARRNLYAGTEESATINVVMPRLEAERLKLRAVQVAFLSGSLQIHPPTREQLAALQQNSTRLDAMLAQGETVDSVMGLIAETGSAFQVGFGEGPAFTHCTGRRTHWIPPASLDPNGNCSVCHAPVR